MAETPSRQLVTYVLHRFPMHTDTFIRREIQELKDQGLKVNVVSVWRPKANETSDALMALWQDSTQYILPRSPLSLLGLIVSSLVRSPAGFGRALLAALKTARPGIKGFAYQLFYFFEAMCVARIIGEKPVGHLHNHIGDQSGTVAMLASVYTRIPYSISFHGWPVFFDVYNTQLKEKVNSCAFTRSISHFCRSQLMMFSGATSAKGFEVVHCGLDMTKYQYRPPRADCRVLFCAARFAPEKGLTFLIEAIRMLRERGQDFELRLAGGGPLLAELKQAVAQAGLNEHVIFLGYLTEAEIAHELSRADLFVLSSYVEGVPVSAMEAMAVGVPVIATNVGGTSELITHGVNGSLIRPADPVPLASEVSRLADNPDIRLQYAAAGRATVETEFDLRVETRKLKQHFEQHLAG